MEQKEDLSPQDLVKKFNKELGEDGLIQLASEYESHFKDRLSTGCVGLDLITNGGLPRAGISQYIGLDSSGKTTFAMKAIKEIQKRFKDEAFVAWAGIEVKFDEIWAENCGVELNDKLHIVAASSAEKLLDTLIKMIRTNKYILIILDSIPALLPEEEELSSQQPGTQAKLIAKFIRIGVYGSIIAAKDNLTALLFLNQYRAKLGGFARFGNVPLEQPGGHSLRHAKMLDIEFKSGQKITEGTGVDQKTYGKSIAFRVLKGKAGAPEGGRSQVDLYIKDYNNLKAGDIDEVKELIIYGSIKDIIVRAGKTYTLYDKKYVGKNELYESLKEPKLFEKLKKDILSV